MGEEKICAWVKMLEKLLLLSGKLPNGTRKLPEAL